MDFYTSPQEKYQVNQAKDSFLLRIGRGDNVLAILHIQHIAFPKYIEHYLNVAIHISEVCALAIRTYANRSEIIAHLPPCRES